ncbi:ACT domain-containing protein [Termitidicoccus mucosus]|uniref:ACT domain-containing protein n=1 Tax=Termitidicoccus mucosus TaxID=1184151 RepID=UPI000A004055
MERGRPARTEADKLSALHTAPDPGATAILELRVRNHPGVMSHITGLFARRAFNLEAILCAPIGDGRESRMLLLVADTPRLEQIERQAAKLHDVLAVRHRTDLEPAVFAIPSGAE